ncbi:hypothetical protein [Turicibacter sp.]|uniref:hypothetical protein n=1 Tax=Turicibacter sp. TaxID=2049042 RepID=UPI001B687822|nr:hypothetical protein [Turicibacter sp.]MBP3904127.1 hypothetical protein [Turicibacter sp.]MBP3908540.1 hypothetical protein [Turicibacter sp.]
MSLNKKDNKKISDDAQGWRTSLYFAPSEEDLFEFVNSQDMKRNKFIITLIREAYERQNTDTTSHSDTSNITNEELLNEIKSLKTFIENHSFKIDNMEKNEVKDVVEEVEESSNILQIADDMELLKQQFSDDMDDL